MKTPRLRQTLLLILVIGLLSGFGYVIDGIHSAARRPRGPVSQGQ